MSNKAAIMVVGNLLESSFGPFLSISSLCSPLLLLEGSQSERTSKRHINDIGPERTRAVNWSPGRPSFGCLGRASGQ